MAADLNESNSEIMLKQMNDKLLLAADVAGIAFWEWNIKTNEVLYDSQWLRMIGYGPNEIKITNTFWEDLIHPDDKDSVLNTLNDHFKNITSSYKSEHRIQNKNGDYIWILDSGRITERDEANNPLKICGISMDITERIISQQRINESEEKYKSIFEHLNDAFCRFDFSGNILEVNKTLRDLLGLKPNESIPNSIKLFFKNSTIKYLHRRLTYIIENQSINFEAEIITPRRKQLPISISAKLITSSGNGVIQALVRDITELKAYEKALFDEKQKFKALIEHSPNVISRYSRNLKCQYISPNVLEIMGLHPNECTGKKLSEINIPKNLSAHLEEKIKWVFRRNKELTVNFSFDSTIGLKHFEAVIVPEKNSANNIESVLMTNSDVTEKVNRENELNQSKLKLQDAEQNVHFGSYEIDLLNNCITWSNETYSIFDRDPLLPPPSMNDYYYVYVHPDDCQMVMENFNESIKLASNFNFTYRIITQSGKTKHISNTAKVEIESITGIPVRVIGNIMDITEKKQIENRLFSERDMLQVIMDNVPDAVYFKDNQGRYIRANNAMAKLLGFKNPEVLIGKTVYDHFPKDIADEFNETEQAIYISGMSILNREKEVPTRYGQVWLSTTIVGVKDQNGNINQIVGISRDITKYKLSEDQLRTAKEKAEQADKLKSTFLANMSHEIRTPINGILGFANLMEIREFERDKQIQYLRIINNSGKLLLNLINDIIDIAKIEAGQINIECSPVDLEVMLKDLSEFYQGEKVRRDKQHIEIRAVIPENNLFRRVKTDPFRLRQVINNLISNSLKFTEQGYIEFGFLFENDNFLFYVRDTGIGIAAKETAMIFERFKQAGHTSKKKEGTGLGLAISKGLVEILGGKIWAKSKLGIGSEFFFTIPNKFDIDTSYEDVNSITLNNLDQFHWPDKKVLLVEDEDVNYIYINELLESTGINLVRVATAEEAINICRTQQEIDLILMDMRLPGINGFDATRLIKRIRNEIPIIAQTAYAMENERKQCLDAGCDHYLSKPFDHQEFFNVLHSYLKISN